MESGGGSRPPPPSLALTSHRITSHRIARHHMLRSCSAAPRRAADHALIHSTRRAQQLQRIMPVLMLPARATRRPIPDRTLHPGNPARPPQPARPDHHWPGFRLPTSPSCSQRMPINMDSAKAAKRPASSEAGLRVVVRRAPIEIGTTATVASLTCYSSKKEAAAPQLLCRPRSSNGSSERPPRHALPPWITHASDM